METTFKTPQQFIVFKMDTQFYGISIQNVQMIEKVKQIIRVPKVPSCIKGVMNLRGEIIPVISLSEQFDLVPRMCTDDARIIIVRLEDAMVGLIVDEVKEVVEIDNEQIETLQNIKSEIKKSYIWGIGKIEDHMITLLNLNSVIEEAFEA